MLRIDDHAHFDGDHPDALGLLGRLGLKLLNICVADEGDGWRSQADAYGKLARESPERYAWCTSFGVPRPGEAASYADRAIAQLDKDFAAGAVACKVWKNFGLVLKRQDGAPLMVDDPLLEPIFAHLEKRGKPLVMHIAEPIGCWQPLDEKNVHRLYYTNNPQYHMYGKAGAPSHADLMAARDRVIERHPRLTVVGAHLGSMEHDLAGLAARLDRYPNFAASLAGRSYDLGFMDRKKVRRFIINYRDRVTFGSDQGSGSVAEMPAEERKGKIERLEEIWSEEFAYYGTDREVKFDGHKARGLALPEDVLEKVFSANARRLYPGL